MIRGLRLALAHVAATPAYAEADLGTALKPLWDFLDMVDRTRLKSALYERPAYLNGKRCKNYVEKARDEP